MLIFCTAPGALDSQTADTLAFEIASVKPVAAPAERVLEGLPENVLEQVGFHGGPGTSDPGRIRYSNVTLKLLLARAFNIKPGEIFGPSWLDEERYEVIANVPAGTSAERLRLMLQHLLLERFQIRMHRETRTEPVYLLTVGENGPKLKPAEASPEYSADPEGVAAAHARNGARIEAMRQASKGGQPGRSFWLPRATISGFIGLLSSNLDRPVVDATGLGGVYSFALRWVPDRPQQAMPDGSDAVAASVGPSIFTAIREQLGLRLQPEHRPFDVLVVDKAAKRPEAN